MMGLRAPTILLIVGLITTLFRPVIHSSQPYNPTLSLHRTMRPELKLHPIAKIPVVLEIGDVEGAMDFAAHALSTSNNEKAKALADKLDLACQQAFDFLTYNESDDDSYLLGTLKNYVRLLVAYYWLWGNVEVRDLDNPLIITHLLNVVQSELLHFLMKNAKILSDQRSSRHPTTEGRSRP